MYIKGWQTIAPSGPLWPTAWFSSRMSPVLLELSKTVSHGDLSWIPPLCSPPLPVPPSSLAGDYTSLLLKTHAVGITYPLKTLLLAIA